MFVCCCASEECRVKGCYRIRQYTRPRDWQGEWPGPSSRQQGCICPPTSEQTCENPMCPRKGNYGSLPASDTGE